MQAGMRILIVVEAADDAHETALTAHRLFPNAEHIVVSAAAFAPIFVTEPLGGGVLSATPTVETLVQAEERADGAIQAAQAELGDDVVTHLEMGDAGRIICEQAVDNGADVIVLGRRSKGWLSRLFDPSVSEYVLRHATCPVLIVPEPRSQAPQEDVLRADENRSGLVDGTDDDELVRDAIA